MDELTEEIQGEALWCKLFADDIILIHETKDAVNNNLKRRRDTLESKGFIPSKSRTKHFKCKFSEMEEEKTDDITISDTVILKVEKFKYLGSIIHKNREIDDDSAYQGGIAKIEVCIWTVVP